MIHSRLIFNIVGLLSSLILIGVSLVACNPSEPNFTFVSTSDDNKEGFHDIYRISYKNGETNTERLTFTPERELSPTISPDGKRILYKIGGVRTEQRLFLLDLENQTTLELQSGFVLPGPWSPDGQFVAYISEHITGLYQLFLLNLNTLESMLVPIEIERQYDIYAVSWSPDGERLALGTAPNRYDLNPGLRLVFIFDLNDKSLSPLTNEDNGDCESPAWSPNGNWIAVICRTNDFGQLFLISPDGHQQKQLTLTPGWLNNTDQLSGNFRLFWEPQWLMDSEHLIYFAKQDLEGSRGLYMTDINGAEPKLLLENPFFIGGVSIQSSNN